MLIIENRNRLRLDIAVSLTAIGERIKTQGGTFKFEPSKKILTTKI